jgi:hypothetical protein
MIWSLLGVKLRIPRRHRLLIVSNVNNSHKQENYYYESYSNVSMVVPGHKFITYQNSYSHSIKSLIVTVFSKKNLIPLVVNHRCPIHPNRRL